MDGDGFWGGWSMDLGMFELIFFVDFSVGGVVGDFCSRHNLQNKKLICMFT